MNQKKNKKPEIKDPVDFNKLVEDNEETFVSPCEKFRLETFNYWQNNKVSNCDTTKVKIFDNESEELLFDFHTNSGHFFHQWLTKDDVDYLICAENLLGGQTVIDLTNKILENYSTNDDGFIWTDFHLSPDGNTLATMGCYWACPYIIKIYNFETPMQLPLKLVKEIELIDNSESIIEWLDDEHLVSDMRERINLINS